MSNSKHPIQPIYKDEHGVERFKSNEIVKFLLANCSHDMNALAGLPFSNEDREQLAQLIGYSLSGFSELPYVSDETYEKAIGKASEAEDIEAEDDAHSKDLEEKVGAVFNAAYNNALAKGLSVLVSIENFNGIQNAIYEVFPDGTKKFVKEIEPRMKIEAGTIYTIPPDKKD